MLCSFFLKDLVVSVVGPGVSRKCKEKGRQCRVVATNCERNSKCDSPPDPPYVGMVPSFLAFPVLSCPVPSLPKAKKPRSSKRTKPHSHHQPVNTKIICHRRRSNSRPSHLSPIAPPVSLTSRNHPSPPSHADHCKDLCRFTGLSNGTQTTTPPRSASRAMEKFH